MDKDFSTLQNRLIYARTRKAWAQDEMARQLKTSRTLISVWENGHGKPRISRMAKLAETLGVRLEWLIFGDGPVDEAQNA